MFCCMHLLLMFQEGLEELILSHPSFKKRKDTDFREIQQLAQDRLANLHNENSNVEFPSSQGPALLFHSDNVWVAIGKKNEEEEEEEEKEESIICLCAKFQNNHHKVIHKG